jgi:hypothetical protein
MEELMSNTQAEGRPRIGRAPATTHGELSHFALVLSLERGFEETTIADIVELVADRLRQPADALEPQAIAWACLGLSLASYEQWLSHADADLLVLIDEAFRKMGDTWGEHP